MAESSTSRSRAEIIEDTTTDHSHVDIPGDSDTTNSPNPPDDLDYYKREFVNATRKGDWDAMKMIGEAHPDTLTMKVFRKEATALHHTLWYGQDRDDIAKGLVKLMTPKDLETQDEEGYTPLALAVYLHRDTDMLQLMIDENEDLVKIGASDKIPIVIASSKGFRDTTEFFYGSTPREIFSPWYENPHDLESDVDPIPGRVGINLLNQCISLDLFDIAGNLLELSPAFLQQWDDYCILPTHALAKAIGSLQNWNIQHGQSRDGNPSYADQVPILICEAYELLQLIIRVKDFDIDMEHSEYIVDAMMEAAKHGMIEFITEMLKFDRELISVNRDGKNMFWHAIMNRQEKVFNLIYAFDRNDMLLSFNLDDKEKQVERGSREKISNILHFTAKLPPSSVLNRISVVALQVQREVQWFKAVQNVTRPRYREDLNESGETPYDLFIKTHKDLLEEGEKFIKTTAVAASAVNSLIVSIMFSATFAVISGTYQIRTSGLSRDKNLFFTIFLVFSVTSFCFCTASMILFLGVLASRYSPEDFVSSLPRKFMRGFLFLSGAIPSMMCAFSCALYIMLPDVQRMVIIPTMLLSLFPVGFFIVSIYPLLLKIYGSTNKRIFDTSTKKRR